MYVSPMFLAQRQTDSVESHPLMSCNRFHMQRHHDGRDEEHGFSICCQQLKNTNARFQLGVFHISASVGLVHASR